MSLQYIEEPLVAGNINNQHDDYGDGDDDGEYNPLTKTVGGWRYQHHDYGDGDHDDGDDDLCGDINGDIEEDSLSV